MHCGWRGRNGKELAKEKSDEPRTIGLGSYTLRKEQAEKS